MSESSLLLLQPICPKCGCFLPWDGVKPNQTYAVKCPSNFCDWTGQALALMTLEVFSRYFDSVKNTSEVA